MGLKIIIFSFLLFSQSFFLLGSCADWLRSSLIYHDENRDIEGFKRHLMRIDSNGQLTGQWLFDAASLTAVSVKGKYVLSGQLTGEEMLKLLDRFFSSASKLDAAISELSRDFGNPPFHPKKIQVSIGYPYIANNNKNFVADGRSYNLEDPNQRSQVGKWYLDGIQSRKTRTSFKNIEIWGLYYIKEDILDGHDEVNFVKRMLQDAHDMGLNSSWIPYHNAPNAFGAKEKLGFDVNSIQPSYGYTGAIDGADIRGNRLYQLGYRSADAGECYEMEFRPDLWISHQYLAIAQLTGCDKFPQLFFVGPVDCTDESKLCTDLFDSIPTLVNDKVIWHAYNEMCDYLQSKQIWNYEIGLDWPQPTSNPNLRTTTWTLSFPEESLSTIRLDFRDENLEKPWRGQLRIIVNGDQKRSSYTYRAGLDTTYPEYNSVIVPFPTIFQRQRINSVRIDLIREPGSDWPLIHRFIAVKFEPTFFANPLYEEYSTSSRPQVRGPWNDSVESYMEGFHFNGKLTDGKKMDNWMWDGVLGWAMITGRLSIYLDLGETVDISSVKVYTYIDQFSGVAWLNNVGVLLGRNCPPQMTGSWFDGLTCVPSGSGGKTTLESDWKQELAGKGSFRGIFNTAVSGQRGRYVTITAHCPYICLLDEVEVVDTAGRLVSSRKSYRLSPGPVDDIHRRVDDEHVHWGDDGRSLVNGFVMRDWVYGPAASGLYGEEQFVECTWRTAKSPQYAIIWMTETSQKFGILIPNSVRVELRNERFEWETGTEVTPSTSLCVISPCARLDIPRGKWITGVRGFIQKVQACHMMTEISIF